jgi:hypothetical protein
VLSGYIDRTLVYIPIPFLISKEPSKLICLSSDIPNIPLLPHMSSINTLVDIWFIGYISENKIFFENFSIPKNNIITVELALFGRDQLSHKLIKEVKIRLWLV